MRAVIKGFIHTIPLTGPLMAELLCISLDLKRNRSTLEEKIESASESLKETATLIDEIEGILKERTEKIEELRKKAEEFSRLAEVEEAKAQPLLDKLEEFSNRGRLRTNLDGFGINILANLVWLLIGVAGTAAVAWIFPKRMPVPTPSPAAAISSPAPTTASTAPPKTGTPKPQATPGNIPKIGQTGGAKKVNKK